MISIKNAMSNFSSFNNKVIFFNYRIYFPTFKKEAIYDYARMINFDAIYIYLKQN